MLEIQVIRERAEDIQTAANRKGIAIDIAELLKVDDRRRAVRRETEELRAARNRGSKTVELLLRGGRLDEAGRAKRETAGLLAALKRSEEKHRELERQFQAMMLQVPNFISPDTPVGASDRDNAEVRRAGQLPVFEFEARSHVQLGDMLDIIDIPRGVKVGGTRQYVLKNGGLMLHRAVQQLALDLLIGKGFDILDVPVMVKEETMIATGFFPGNRDQSYAIQGEDKWLAGTSEVPLISYYGGEIVDLQEPKLLGAVSACYRSEVGSAGRDVQGLYRVHQFAKVEQVVICQANLPEALARLEELTANSEELLRLLELPYRVVAVCTGDLSQKNYKQYDIETWMPSRGNYGETHSASLLLDFQARRSNIRYRDENGKLKHAYTLNNTMAATPRLLIPLLENHQREDGSVYIPPALRPYMQGMEALSTAR
ncbi:serine--tRNA ligase [Paenibacillus sacheonensis]|uniref:Serine--tRNA ligase n=1 Tax=Paenibacillus sacheonensis TaxID=742054 RepID=A0A7X5BZE6_9BACL|nr:serine--tRNA ligase [Paenibacillus sacheonensis]MBM7563312.1 seryl-tRNA synthetase [Paenibacillus sacheonensis]NBC68130.1 serine--tRNA ligase [Paenibacillus sacheonensis]